MAHGQKGNASSADSHLNNFFRIGVKEMKKIVAIVLCSALLFVLVATVSAAEFTASKTLVTDSITKAEVVDSTGKTVEAQIVSVASDVTDESRTNFKSSTKPTVMITSVAQAVKANETAGDAASGETVTDSGLTVAENAFLKRVYDVVKAEEKTDVLLESIGLSGAELAGVIPETDSLSDYTASALFDISMNQVALDLLGEDGKMVMDVQVPGVKAGDSVLVIKLSAAAETEAGDGDLAGEVLEATVNADGSVSIAMVGFGPVLILVNANA